MTDDDTILEETAEPVVRRNMPVKLAQRGDPTQMIMLSRVLPDQKPDIHVASFQSSI